MKAILTLAMAATIGMCQYSHAASTRHLSVKTDSATPASLRLGKACHRTAPASGSPDQEEWTLVGTGSYTDDILTNSGVESATWDVDIYESASTPGFYRVANPFGNGNCPTFPDPFECCDFLLHAENPDAVWMEFVEMKNVDFGIMDGEYCPAFIGDMAGYYIDAGYFDAETAIAMGMAGGSMAGGCITFGKEELIMDFPYYPDGLTFAANLSGLFRVALPGAKDLTFRLEYDDICTDGTLSFGYSAGADIEEIRYAVYPGLHSFMTSDDALFDNVCSDGTIASGGLVSIEPEYGVNTVAAVALAEGRIVGKDLFYCYGQQENASEWTDIGQAEYSEDVLASIYPEDLSHVVYKVDVQQNNANPGRYRLVNTYGPSYPFYDMLADEDNILTGHSHNHYLVIDASDPDRVFIEAAPLGMHFGYGQSSIFSEGWLSMQLGADLDNPDVIEGFGTLADNKITFLGGAIFVYMPEFGMPRGNIYHKFYIMLPDNSSVSSVGADSSAPAEYYTLDGVRLGSLSPCAPGAYIRRCGDRTEKILIR